jgi:hypothetical protein
MKNACLIQLVISYAMDAKEIRILNRMLSDVTNAAMICALVAILLSTVKYKSKN